MTAGYFTLEQKENIMQLFDLDFLDKLEEMKTSLEPSFSKRKIPSQSCMDLDRKSSLMLVVDEVENKSDDDKPNSPKNSETESVDDFRSLLEALQYTPKINGPSDFSNHNERLINNILEKAEKFKNSLELKGAGAHLIALAHLIFKPIAAAASYVSSVLLGAIVGGTASAVASPAIAPWGAIAGGVIGADVAKTAAKKLGITTQSMFSEAHRRARQSADIEKIIKDKVEYARR